MVRIDQAHEIYTEVSLSLVLFPFPGEGEPLYMSPAMMSRVSVPSLVVRKAGKSRKLDLSLGRDRLQHLAKPVADVQILRAN